MSQSGPEPDPRIREALSAIAAERGTATAEIEAWEAFRRRLGKIASSLSPPRQASQRGEVTALGSPGEVCGDAKVQETVRTAFEETVFSIDAVDDLESDPYALMRAELGTEIAATVYESPPPPRFVPVLREAAENVLGNRRHLVELLDAEERSIRESWSALQPVREELDSYRTVYPDVSAQGLFVYHKRLGELHDRCEAIAVERQASLHSSSGVDHDSIRFIEYLYEDCSVTFPALSAVTTTVRDVADLRADLRRDISTLEVYPGPIARRERGGRHTDPTV